MQQLFPFSCLHTEMAGVNSALASGVWAGAYQSGGLSMLLAPGEAPLATQGWLGDENCLTGWPAGGGGATDDAMSAAPGQARVGNGSGAGKGFFRPVRRSRLKW